MHGLYGASIARERAVALSKVIALDGKIDSSLERDFLAEVTDKNRISISISIAMIPGKFADFSNDLRPVLLRNI